MICLLYSDMRVFFLLYNIIVMSIYKGKIGSLGEEIVVLYLKGKGFTILARNYTYQGIGEIDIIALKSDILHFIEVKTSENTSIFSEYHSIIHFDRKKRERIIKTMEYFCFTRNITNITRCVDLAGVSLSPVDLTAKIAYEENIFMSTI